ncbi:MAG: type II toxin-antitoxin system VapC family toxin [Actinobacteria bacterium]|nr:MAG: type II toxin-antitoxin system VapC family toxin [Actinomycetota bacterium]
MRRLTLDASALIVRLLREPRAEAVEALAGSGTTLAAPDLLILESANAIWKAARRADLGEAECDELLAEVMSFDVDLHPSAPLAPAALRLAREIGETVYDCLYLVLAIDEDAPLLTADRRLVDKARATGLGEHVVWIGETG